MRFHRRTLLVLLTLCLAVSLRAQENPTFKSSTELVLVPTIVVDKSGHVSGLKREDFTVLDSGQPQKITFFEEVKTASAPLQRAAVNGYFSNVFASSAGSGPREVSVILLDMVNGNNLDFAVARKEVMRYLETMRPNTAVGLMLFTHYGLRVLYDIADDPATLIAAMDQVSKKHNAIGDDAGVATALDRNAAGGAVAVDESSGARAAGAADFLGGFTDMSQFFTVQDSLDTAKMLSILARMLRGIPGRKSVIWITNGFDMTRTCPSNADDGPLGRCNDSPLMTSLRMLTAANVVLYPVDARGLVGGQAGNSTWSQRPTRTSSLIPMAGRDNIDTLKTMADLTGGRAYYGTNDLAGAVKKAQDDASQFYMLAFYADRSPSSKPWHPLTVKVNRPGVEVHTRVGYAVEKPGSAPVVPTPNELRFVTSSSTDFTEVAFAVRWTGQVAAGNAHRADFELLMLPGSFHVDEKDNNHMNFDIEADAHQVGSTKTAAQLKRTADGHLSADQMQKSMSGGLPLAGSLTLEPGEYSVRFVIRDNLGHGIGALSVPLRVEP